MHGPLGSGILFPPSFRSRMGQSLAELPNSLFGTVFGFRVQGLGYISALVRDALGHLARL